MKRTKSYCILILILLIVISLTKNIILQSIEDVLQPFPAEQPLCIIARTYPNKFDYLATFLMSLSQNSVPPKIFLVITDQTEDISLAEKHVDFVNKFLGYKLSEILPLQENDAKSLSLNYKSDYGYAYTDAAINKIINENAKHKCKYLLVTNGDNLYRNQFIDDYLSLEIDNQVDMIGFNFISHHSRFSNFSSDHEKDDGRNHEFKVAFAFASMDLGACFFKFDLFENYDDLRFVGIANLNGGDFFNSDGLLIAEAYRRSNSSMIIRDVLFFHQ